MLAGGGGGGGDQAAVAGCSLAVVLAGWGAWREPWGVDRLRGPQRFLFCGTRRRRYIFPGKHWTMTARRLARGWPHSLRNIWSQKTRAEGLGLGEKSLPP